MTPERKYAVYIWLCAVAMMGMGCVSSSTATNKPSSAQIVREQDVAHTTIQTLREAVHQNPRDVNARLSLAAALQDNSELAEAEQEIERVLERIPDSVLAHNFLGDLYLEHGKKDAQSGAEQAQAKLESAVRLFERSLELAPEPNLRIAALLGIGAAYSELGKFYLQRKQTAKAEEVEEKAQSAFRQLTKVCPQCEQQLKTVAIERVWPHSGFSAAYQDFHLISFEARIRRVQDEISKIRRESETSR